MRTFPLLATVACLWLAPTVQALSPPEPPRHILVVAQGEVAPRVVAASIHTRLDGLYARTSVEMTFHNPSSRMLEGQLQFPLQAGQTITGFALDIDGKLRDAVAVERSKGQEVFEDVIRQRIDPALLEVTEGNNFRLRVYPLPAQGTRRVVLHYDEVLTQGKQGLIYRLPLSFGPDAPAVDWRISGAAAQPAVLTQPLGGLKFQSGQDGWSTRVDARAVRSGMPLSVRLPDQAGVVVSTQVGPDGQTYFFARVPLPEQGALRPAPKKLLVLWDASLSTAGRSRDKELAFLDQYLRQLGDVAVQLVLLRDTEQNAGEFQVRRGEWSQLRTALGNAAADGGTRLTGWQNTRADQVLLFSDGLDNSGEALPPVGQTPIHVLASGERQDVARLRKLSQESGGTLVLLDQSSVADAVNAVRRQESRLVDVTGDGVEQLVLGQAESSSSAAVAGVLKRGQASLTLMVRDAHGQVKSMPLQIRDTAPRGLAALMWAKLRLNHLEAEPELNRGAIRQLGQKFSLATRETSLLVLDRVEDYVRHAILPPVELRGDYERLRSQLRTREQAESQTQIDRVVRQFEDKQAWWARSFPKGERAVSLKAKDDRATSGVSDEQRDRAQQIALARQEESSRREDSPRRAERRVMAAAPAPAAEAAPGLVGSARPVAAKAVAASPGPAEPSASIVLKPMAADATQARRLREASKEQVYRIYLDERSGQTNSSAYFLDAADVLLEKGEKALALRVLSNLAEMDVANRALLRILGYRYMQAGEAKRAIAVFRRVLELAPNEPQSWRDLGLALAADKQYQAAVDQFAEVIRRPWHGRFPEIELITVGELNAMLATCACTVNTSQVDPRLLKNLPVDLRAVLSWDADNTDIDLWVIDPNGEKAFYGNRLTYQGGRMSQDFVGGYGPEEFMLRQAKPGKYLVQAQFYGHRQQVLSGATTLQLKLTTGFGSPRQKEQSVTLRLKSQRDVITVGEFVIAE